mgnify:FL=1
MLQLVISLCIGASVMMELVVELVRAEIFVLNVASLSARPAGQLGPLKARQPPGLFAYAGYAGSARCSCARMCCSSEFITPLVVWLVVESTAPVWVQRFVYQVVSDMP